MFDDADNIHAIDAGFLEYLAASAQPLQKLLVQLQALPFPDRAAAQAAVAAHASEMRECVARLARDHLPPEVERMLQRAETTDIATRCRAIRELSQYPHPKVIQNLQNLILSENRPEIQTSAIDTLAVIDGPGCIDVFGKALLEAKSDDVKNEAALALLPLAATYPAAAAFLAEASKGDLNAVLCDILTPLHKTT
jgi:hypothetical protein